MLQLLRAQICLKVLPRPFFFNLVNAFPKTNWSNILKLHLSGACFLSIAAFSKIRPRCIHAYCEDYQYPYTTFSPHASTHTTWTWTDISVLLWPEFATIVMAVLAALTAAVMNVLIPGFLGNVADVITGCFGNRDSISAIYVPAGKLFSLYLLQSVATFFYIGLLGSAGERIAQRLRNELFAKLVRRDLAYFDVHSAGKLIDSITSDVQSFKSSFKSSISTGLRGITQVAGAVYALFAISTPLTLTLLGTLPCVFLVGGFMGSELRQLSRQAQTQALLTTSVAEESFANIRSVKSLALEDTQAERFRMEAERSCKLGEHLGYGIGLFQGLSNLALNGVVLTVLFMGGHLLSDEGFRPAHLLSFLATTQTIQRSLAQLSLLYGQVIRGSTALSRIVGILNTPNRTDIQKISEHEASQLNRLCEKWKELGCAPAIRFDSVRFAYPSRPDTVVLDALDLSVSSGQIVALVGKSGAGKSTVVSLLERFYDPLSGRITLDGYDINDFCLASLRGQIIGYISQEPQIFNASVRENIRLGKLEATDQQVEEAARLANAHEFIVNQLPHGYDTLVGQGSDAVAGLSGGQRQRIAIARALLKNAPVLLLDEATSSLDAQSEAQVQDALKTAMKGRTVLIIAHRLSTIQNANLIVVLSEGKVVEQGSHHELMLKRGHYYALVRSQNGINFIH